MTIAATGGWIESWTTRSATARDRVAPTSIRHVASMTFGFLVAFLAMDFALDGIHLPHVYGSRNMARWKWEMYEHTSRTPDVVFVGCSYEWCGISPRVIDAEVRQSIGRDPHSLNLSASASSSLTQFFIARRMVDSGRWPKLVYLGVSPAMLNASSRNWLINGIRALGTPRDVPLVWHSIPEVFLEGVRTAMFRSYRDWDDIRMMAGRFLLAAPLNPTAKLRDHDDGWGEWIGDDRHPKDLAGSSSANEIDEESSLVVADYRPNSVNALALRETIALLRHHGIEVRLLEMPLAPNRTSSEDHPDSNAAYRNLIDPLARELDVPIVSAPGDFSIIEFFDPVHLNAAGAKRYSKWLADDVADALREPNSTRTAQAHP